MKEKHPYLVVLTPEQRALLRSLAEGRDAPADSAANAAPQAAVELTHDEMVMLRRLSGLATAPGAPQRTPSPDETQPPRPKRTADLTVSQDELDLLRRLSEPSPSNRRRRPKRTTDIVLSQAEVEFLRALSGKDLQTPAGSVSTLRKKLSAENEANGSPVLVSLSPDEAEWLNTITREGYSFITPGERRARLVLREKLHAAMAARQGVSRPESGREEPAD